METNTTPTPDAPARRPAAPLWWSAAALGVIALVQVAGRPAAYAGESGMVSRAGVTTMLTADIGPEDLLFLLDNRSDELSVYRVDSRAGLELLQRLPVGQVFIDARARSLGRP